MNYKTHLNGGIVAGLYVVCKMQDLTLVSTGLFLSTVAIGSLLPDIDHKNSYIGSKTKGLSKAINKLAGHRKLFHAPLLYLLLYSLGLGICKENIDFMVVNGLFLGILSHLILDSFTIGGLPWFYPFSKQKFSLAKIKTSSNLEESICLMLCCINVAILLDMLHITSIFVFTQK